MGLLCMTLANRHLTMIGTRKAGLLNEEKTVGSKTEICRVERAYLIAVQLISLYLSLSLFSPALSHFLYLSIFLSLLSQLFPCLSLSLSATCLTHKTPSGPSVTVGVSMYVLSISRLSEVEMVSKCAPEMLNYSYFRFQLA